MNLDEAIEIVQKMKQWPDPVDRHNADLIMDALEVAKEEVANCGTIMMRCLRAMPCGHIPSHTIESLPDRIRDLAQECGKLASENDRLTDRIAELEKVVEAAKAYRQLAICYRINKRPTEALHERLRKADEALAALGKEASNDPQ